MCVCVCVLQIYNVHIIIHFQPTKKKTICYDLNSVWTNPIFHKFAPQQTKTMHRVALALENVSLELLSFVNIDAPNAQLIIRWHIEYFIQYNAICTG